MMHYTNNDNPIDFPKSMKYWTIAFPGEFGQHVQETWSEDQIMESYYRYWVSKMLEHHHGPHADITRENCIADWCSVHWAQETDQWGNSLVGPKTGV